MVGVLSQVAASAAQYTHTLQAVDITDAGNEHLERAYQYDIPVLHINDKFWVKHRLSESAAMRGLDLARQGLFEAQDGEPTAVVKMAAQIIYKT